MADKLNTLGLAYRARKAVLGEEVLNRIDKIKLMFIASDISEKSRERYYKIDHIDEYSGEQLSSALGKNNVKVVGILDKGFKDALLKNK